MIKILKASNKLVLPKADYNFEKYEQYCDLVPMLTPKFEGKWVLVLNDFKISEVTDILNTENNTAIDVYILLRGEKYDTVIKENPKYYTKQKTAWESYKELIANMNCMIDKRAMSNLYKAIGPNIIELQKALSHLKDKAKDDLITNKLVTSEYNVTTNVYSSDVLEAFYSKQKNRWTLANKFLNDLGNEYAYRAMLRYVRNLLQDKSNYLTNKNVRLRETKDIDAPFIAYAYSIIENVQTSKDFILFLVALENRNQNSLNTIRRQ